MTASKGKSEPGRKDGSMLTMQLKLRDNDRDVRHGPQRLNTRMLQTHLLCKAFYAVQTHLKSAVTAEEVLSDQSTP